MRRLLLIALLFTSVAGPGQEMQDWQEIAGDSWTSIVVDKAMYRSDQSPCFFVHVQIRNRKREPIGFPFKGMKDIIKPNQWGFYATDQRGIIDELMPISPELSKKEGLEIVQQMKSGILQAIPARQQWDYFVMFNRSTPEHLQKKTDGYLIISFVGSLHFTDGSHVLSSSLDRREVPIRVPVTFKSIPRGANVVEDQCTPAQR